MKHTLPDKVIERLSLYRQTLVKYFYAASPHIISADLARTLGISEENVRRDLMLIGCRSTTLRKGFSIPVIIGKISEILDYNAGKPCHIIIIGNGTCIKDMLVDYPPLQKIVIAGVFNFNNTKIQVKDEITYYPLGELFRVITKKEIPLAVLNISADYVEQICEILVSAGIKGIINFTPVKLRLPSHIYVDDVNFTTILDKAIYKIKSGEMLP